MPKEKVKKPTVRQLRNALLFYADDQNYVNRESIPPGDLTMTGWMKTVVITKEVGRLARQVLGLELPEDKGEPVGYAVLRKMKKEGVIRR